MKSLIRILPGEVIVEGDPSKTVLQLCLESKIPLAHACGGEGKCSTCRVAILEGVEQCGEASALERNLAQRFAFPDNIRLGCQLRVKGEVSLRRLVLDAEDQMLASRPLLENLPTAVGLQRPMAILFADIRGFTTFSEDLLPYDIVHALNRYFFHMGKVIYEHGGEINNYMGDGLIALFSKGDESECCHQAVQAGLGMIREMDAVKDYLKSSYGRSFGLGIGVHYGEVIDGTIGYRETQRRTVIGDSVNFASRVESMTKEFGVPFLVSETVYQSLKEREGIQFHPRGESFIRGKTGLHFLYEVGNSF